MAVWLSRALRATHYSVRLFEINRPRAEELAEKLDHVTVLQSDPTDLAVFAEEKLGNADVFIAMTGDDERNILAAAQAKKLGTKIAIVAVKRAAYLHLLEHVGINEDAVYVAYYGADKHASGDPNKVPISRGVPLSKALEKESLIAWAMNGEDIPHMNGYPLRLVCGGWPASVCGKWLNKIVIRNQVHDGPKMTGTSYRVPCKPVAPGSEVPEDQLCIIESMPVKSLITFPKSGIEHVLGKKLALRGHAWAGDNAVSKMHVSIDFGATWQKAKLESPANRLAWQHWNTAVKFPEAGYYEIWARATDDAGRAQPMVLPGWNPKGYLNNACHRIAVQVA